MNAPARAFSFQPAVRERVSLIVALAGASGSGKTLSALKIARGLAGGDDTKIAVIDTEAGRAKHYAVAPGEQPGPERFAFHHGDLRPPFTPEAYADAIRAADDTNRYEVIVVDSCSHEYEGEGGLHEMHDAAVGEAVEKARASHNESWGRFDEARAADRASVGAWREPKTRHKRFVSRLLQCRAHLILCLRADEKIRIEQVKDERGRSRTVIVQPKDMPPAERWVPICEKRFMYEMTLSLILTPQQPGIPIPIKLQAQHRDAVPLEQHLSENTGRLLSEWSRGGAPTNSESARGDDVEKPRAPAAPAVQPQTPASTTAGAVPIPSAEAYVARWHDLVDSATKKAQGAQLAQTWNDEKPVRDKVTWPDTEDPASFGKLQTKVRKAIDFLREHGT